MQTVIVIPARYGSQRLPGKPLALIAGMTLIQRVWRIASVVTGVDRVLIATDDRRIAEHAQSFGAEAVMTEEECQNGTERVVAALEQLCLCPEIVLNLQGDAVLTPPWVIQALMDTLQQEAEIGLATPAAPLSWAQYQSWQHAKERGIVGGTMVVFDRNHKALYFSKNLIPFVRDPLLQKDVTDLPLYQHIGLYAYRWAMLKRYVQLPPSRLEQLEGLEQLRALENGIPIHVVPVDYRGRTHASIDSPEDVQSVERILAKEGEGI